MRFLTAFLSGDVCVIVRSDELCGTLHCDVPDVTDFQPDNFRTDWTFAANWRWRNPDNTVAFYCRIAQYLTFYNGPDKPNPGLVPDGAACGTGKVTVSTTINLVH